MNYLRFISILGFTLVLGSVLAGTGAHNHYKTLTLLDGDWMLSPAPEQEGGATKKEPASTLVDSGRTAISFMVIGKGRDGEGEDARGQDESSHGCFSAHSAARRRIPGAQIERPAEER